MLWLLEYPVSVKRSVNERTDIFLHPEIEILFFIQQMKYNYSHLIYRDVFC